MYINSGLENSDIHKSLVNVTGLESELALSILNFAYLHGGCIAGSCALAMYLERNNMPSFRPGDIDIYIPSRTGRYSLEERKKEEPPDMPYPRRPFLDDAYRAWYSSKNFGKNASHWNDIDKMFLTEFSQYYERVSNLYTNNRIDSYYLDTDHLPNMDNLKENEKKEMFGLLWTTITKFKRKHPRFDETRLHWSVQTGFRFPGRTPRYNGETYKQYDGQNYDYSKECNSRSIMFCSTPPGQQEIQLIFLKEDVDVHQYIAKNYDFSVCKVYTSLQTLKQEHKLVSLHEESIKNRILNIPNNWKYITFAACFKTVTRRFIKYTQRGFIPIHYKAFEAPLLKKQAIYDAMKKSSMKFNAGIVSDSVKMREESLKKLIEKDYNEEGMNGWRNFSQEKSSTPLADSYRKMTIMLKQYLYYKILQTYEENRHRSPPMRPYPGTSTSEDESSSEDEERYRASLRRGARVRHINAVPEYGYESFDENKAYGIWISLDEDISNLIADFKKFDMVNFWKSSPGKEILRHIPARGERDVLGPRRLHEVLTFSDEDLILSKSILTFFLEDIRILLGRALWFLYDKTIKIRNPDRAAWPDYLYVYVSKEDPSWLGRELEVFNDDGSIKNEFNQSEFLAEISEPAINRIYRNRASTRANEGVDESKSHDSFEEHGDDVLLHADAAALLRDGTLRNYEYSDLTARLRELSQRGVSHGRDAYNKDPHDIHMRTLISNMEGLQGLGTHNKEAVVRKIRSNLRGGKKKKLRRIIKKIN